MNRLLRITSVLGAVLALSACVAPGYGPRHHGGGGYGNHANSQGAYRGGYRGGHGGGWSGHSRGWR